MKRVKRFFRGIKNKAFGFWRWFRRASWKKKTVVIIGILIILFVLKGIFFPKKKNNYIFDTVQKGSISQLVTETGNVASSNETDVFSPTTGDLDQVFVKNGDYVNQGDQLFTVRSTATAQEQAAAYANYQSALSNANAASENQLALQTQLEQARQAVISAQSAVDIMNANVGGSKNNPSTGSPYTQNDKDAINSALTSSHENFSTIEKKYNDVGTAIGAAQAAVNSTSLAYQATQNTTVTAPVSGTISNVIGLSGAKVVAEINSTTAAATAATVAPVTPVLIIGSTNSGTAIKTTVSEVDINKVALGQKVDIVFSAIPNKTYKGTIVQIDTYGTNTAGVVTYNVFVSLNNADSSIKPNMTANLTIYTAQESNVLTVANAAIVPYQNGKAVQTLQKNGKVKFIPVQIGLRGFARSEIVSGVGAGTKVILGNTQLTNNQSGGPQNP